MKKPSHGIKYIKKLTKETKNLYTKSYKMFWKN